MTTASPPAAPAVPAAARSSRDLVLVALLGALLFLPGLGARDLWNPDEARYAEVAREMRLFDSYAVPRLNGEVYTQKPPLLFWSILAASLFTGGVGETAARLPSALAGIGALLLVFLTAERLFGRRAAWLAVFAYATCFKTFWQARFGQIDMLLGFLVALGVWFWVRAWSEDRPRLALLFYLAAGLGTLAKGPVALLPPLFGIVAFLIWQKDWKSLRRLHVGLGLLVWAAVVLAWLVPAGLSGGREYLDQIVFRQNVTRYADPWHHHQPPWYYLTTIPADFFPWSFLLPGALVAGWRLIVRNTAEPERARQGFRFALCWAIATVVFFSLSPGKRTVYVFQMFPALALLVGAGLDRLAAAWPELGPGFRRWLSWPLGLLAGLGLLVVAAVAVAGPRREEAQVLGGAPFVALVVAALVPLAAGAAWALLDLRGEQRRGRVERAAASLAAGSGLMLLLVGVVLLPRFDLVKSARPMAKVLLSRMAPGEPYGIYPRLDSTFLFYTEKFAVPLEGEDQLRAFAARPGRIWLLVQRDDLAKLKGGPLPLTEVARDPDPQNGYVLLTRPGS
jgi:4-amino-4-deoxy-L-arabinose transferase-like glycosyltransferase